MILVWLIVIPVIGGLVAWIAGRGDSSGPGWISLAALFADLALVLDLLVRYASFATGGQWLVDFNQPWIPTLGISFHLAADGLSLIMVALSVVLGIVAVLCSWSEIRERVGFFHLNLMVTLGGIIGVFLAMDLILFYFFWEVMLVPTYFLIGIWGHENRIYAAIKFFIFTQAGGLFMLFAILGLYFEHGTTTGTYTFDYFQLLGTSMPLTSSMLLMIGFFVAFAVKLPAVPFHTWLPDAHTEAPTAGSVILAGLLLKTGAYGMLRFMLPLFPDAVEAFTSAGMTIAVVGILYGAILAFAQTDLKRLVAYSSISHMGFVMLGIFDRNQLGLQGAVVQMLCHGLSTGALFVLVGALQERTGTREMHRMGGLWSTVPRLSGMALVLAVASLGLPGMGNFIGEILVLVGTYEKSVAMTVLAVLGLVLAAVYSLSMMQRTFFGENTRGWTLPDLSLRETFVLGTMIAMLVWLGLYPQPVLNTAQPSLGKLTQSSVSQNIQTHESQ
jgi:NADH-quinone oxidoreductase subunit M